MINKRLISLVPASMSHVRKKVLVQCVSLIFSIIFVFVLSGFVDGIIHRAIKPESIIIFIAISLGAVLIRYVMTILAAKEGFRASVEIKNLLRDSIYKKMLSAGEGYKKHMSTADVLQNAIDGVEQLEIYFSSYLPQLFYSIIAPVVLFAVLSFIDIKSALTLILCVPLIPLSIMAIQRLAKKTVKKYWKQYLNLSDVFLENIQGLNTLKIYQADAYKHKKMNDEAEDFRKITMKMLMMQLNSIIMMDFIAYGGTALGVMLATYGYINGNLNLCGTLIIILLCSEFFLPLRLLGSFFHVAMNGMAAIEKIFTILDMEDEKDSEEEVDDFSVNVENMSYKYTDGKEALRDINFTAGRSGFIGIVGKSGCGKSTFAEILANNYSDYDGSIKLGGKELKSLGKKFLKKHITLISMNNHIFKGTVRENLYMANRRADDKEMNVALEKTKLLDFFNSKEGLDTKINEGGSNLSGGQRQRLAVARALLHESDIYIFDEASSNIDVESEENIISILHMLSKDKTVIFISHRLANVMKADCIYVFDNGKAAEKGRHEELLERNGIYRELWDKQYELECCRGGIAV